MAFYSGKDGELWIDGVKAARVKGWSVNTTVTALPTTSLGQTDSTVTSGIRSTTGSCSLFYYEEVPGKVGDCGKLLMKVMKPADNASNPGKAAAPENVFIKLKISDGTSIGRYIEGSCLITNASMSMSVGEVLAADIAFQFNGAPKEVVL